MMDDDPVIPRMLAQLNAFYPEGIVALTRSGRRLTEPQFRPCAVGWITTINGSSLLFDHDGRFLSRDGENLIHIARAVAARRTVGETGD
jgi:hypothetical protein